MILIEALSADDGHNVSESCCIASGRVAYMTQSHADDDRLIEYQDVTSLSGRQCYLSNFSLHAASLSHLLCRQKSPRQDVDNIGAWATLSLSPAELTLVKVIASSKPTPGAPHSVPYLETVVELQDSGSVIG